MRLSELTQIIQSNCTDYNAYLVLRDETFSMDEAEGLFFVSPAIGHRVEVKTETDGKFRRVECCCVVFNYDEYGEPITIGRFIDLLAYQYESGNYSPDCRVMIDIETEVGYRRRYFAKTLVEGEVRDATYIRPAEPNAFELDGYTFPTFRDSAIWYGQYHTQG